MGIAITGWARMVAGCSVPPGVDGLEGITFLGCTSQSGSFSSFNSSNGLGCVGMRLCVYVLLIMSLCCLLVRKTRSSETFLLSDEFSGGRRTSSTKRLVSLRSLGGEGQSL